MTVELVRLSKLMAERGLCSRREADSYIERGWVLVDGAVVDTLGTKVLPDVSITLKHSAQNIRPAPLPRRAKGNGAENGGA